MAKVPGGPDTELITGITNGDVVNVTFGAWVWVAQCFTLPSTHLSWRVAVKLGYNSVTPRHLQYAIRYTLAGKPDGADMATTEMLQARGDVIPAGVWYAQNFPEWNNLGPGEWALVVRVPLAAVPWAWWCRAADALPPGITGKAWKSTNSGVTWTEISGYYLLHQVWGTPTLDPVPPPEVVSNWAPLDWTHEPLPTAYQVQVETDAVAHLYMRHTLIPPRKHPIERFRRGLAMPWNTYYCFVAWTETEQEEPGDSLEHTFIFYDWPVCETRYFYFIGTKRLYPTPSASPIFELHRYEEWVDPTGTIVRLIDSLEFDPIMATVPQLSHIDGNVYAVVYQDGYNDGWVRTVKIDEDGTLGPLLDALEFDPLYGRMPHMTHVTVDMYAIAYTGPSGYGIVKTLTIANNGTIGPVADTRTFHAAATVTDPRIVHIAGTVYAIFYTGPGNDGYVLTLSIDFAGNIGPVIDYWEFDFVLGLGPDPILVGPNIWAIAYRASSISGAGKVTTCRIDDDGVITGPIDSQVYAATQTSVPCIFHATGTVYGIATGGPDGDGWLYTLTISDMGAISPVIDTWEYDPVDADDPSVVALGDHTYAIAYRGPAFDGWLRTVTINDSGGIGAEVDNEEYDPTRGAQPSMLHVSGNVFAIAYSGPDYDGWLRTIEIVSNL